MADIPSGGSVPAITPARPEFVPWTVAGALAVVVAATIVGQLGAVVLAQALVIWGQGLDTLGDFSAVQKLPLRQQTLVFLGATLASQCLELALIWWIAGRGGADRRQTLGLTWVSLRLDWWIKAVLGLFAIKVLATLVASRFTTLNVKEELQPFVEIAQDGAIWPLFLGMVVLAALIEELVFRGVLSRTLEATRLGVWGGAILANLLFAGLHLQYGFGGQFVILALGLGLSYIRRCAGSLWPGIVGHALNNAVAVIAMRSIT